MYSLKCDVCGHPATIHETVVDGGVAVSRSFCQSHGLTVWQAAVPQLDQATIAAASNAMTQRAAELTDKEKAQLAQLRRFTSRSR